MLSTFRREHLIAPGGKGDPSSLRTRAEERLDIINSAAGVKARRTGKELTVRSEGRTRDWVLVFRILTPILATVPVNHFNLSFSLPITLSHNEGLEQLCLTETEFNSHTSISVVSLKR